VASEAAVSRRLSCRPSLGQRRPQKPLIRQHLSPEWPGDWMCSARMMSELASNLGVLALASNPNEAVLAMRRSRAK